MHLNPLRLLLLGLGAALGLALWPLLLPVVVLACLLSGMQHRSGLGQKSARPSPQPETTARKAVLDPMVRAQALAQAERISTELRRDQLERSFRKAP